MVRQPDGSIARTAAAVMLGLLFSAGAACESVAEYGVAGTGGVGGEDSGGAGGEAAQGGGGDASTGGTSSTGGAGGN